MLQSSGDYRVTEGKVLQGWSLPFTDVTDENQVKKEIEQVLDAFWEKDNACEINLKKLEKDGFITRVWTWGGKTLAGEVLDEEVGPNGTMMAYFDADEKVRLIVSEGHGSSWFAQNYFYRTSGGEVFQYSFSAELTYDDEGMGHFEGEDLPLHQRLETSDEIGTPDFQGIAEQVKLNAGEAANLEDNRSGIYNFQGQISWKYDFIMNLDIGEFSEITGKYRYRKSSADLLLSGKLREETFFLEEKDANGKVTGTWKGRWTELDRIEGYWFKPGSEEGKYFEMKPIGPYQFQD